MTISKKMSLSFMIIILILFTTGILSVYANDKTNKSSKHITDQIIPIMEVTQALDYEFTKICSFTYEHVTLTSKADMEEVEDKINTTRSTFVMVLRKKIYSSCAFKLAWFAFSLF